MKTPLLRGLLLLTFLSGCGAVEESQPTDPSPEQLGRSAQAEETDNGLAFNGLAFNGLAFNGLAFNGLAFNGLSSSNFASWFQQDSANASLFMKYLVRCAVPDGQTRTYTSGTTTYTWTGGLGLATGWASGAPATLDEQQTVSACIAALTNKYGRSVQVSVLGLTAQHQPIPTSGAEQAAYTLHEGCFFGNLFNGDGLFVGNDQGMLLPNQSSLRACALGGPAACAPALTHVGDCHHTCVMDSTGTYFTSCTHNGKTYHALTTRLPPQDIYTCGDGHCQFPEVCAKNGPDNSPGACKNDCGTCG